MKFKLKHVILIAIISCLLGITLYQRASSEKAPPTNWIYPRNIIQHTILEPKSNDTKIPLSKPAIEKSITEQQQPAYNCDIIIPNRVINLKISETFSPTILIVDNGTTQRIIYLSTSENKTPPKKS